MRIYFQDMRFVLSGHGIFLTSCCLCVVATSFKRRECSPANANMYQYMRVVNHVRRLLTRPPLRPPVKGFNAPFPREVGKETLFRGLRLSNFLVRLFSLFLRSCDFEVFAMAAAPSTSISNQTQLALDSHSASAEEAGQRQA
jgi:hypothetical protein